MGIPDLAKHVLVIAFDDVISAKIPIPENRRAATMSLLRDWTGYFEELPPKSHAEDEFKCPRRRGDMKDKDRLKCAVPECPAGWLA